MIIFHLPDLGEGLPDATIREWFVHEGDTVTADQPLVVVETAKALVEVPAPHDGTIERLFAQVNETIETGKPLAGFQASSTTADAESTSTTVVGNLETSDKIINHTATIQQTNRCIATPAARALARQLHIELTDIPHQGSHISKADVEAAAGPSKVKPAASDMYPLPAQRKAMAMAMTQSQQQVATTTIFDEADISTWDDSSKMTIRMIRALSIACEQEPILNSHFDAKTMSYKQFDVLHLGIAIDTPNGLFVPVIKQANQLDEKQLIETINTFKEQARTHAIHQKDLHGATLTLSNFGTIAGRFATPLISPPEVAIIAVGRATNHATLVDDKLTNRRLLPLSLSFDHRLVTGGEAARFLQAMIIALSSPQ